MRAAAAQAFGPAQGPVFREFRRRAGGMLVEVIARCPGLCRAGHHNPAMPEEYPCELVWWFSEHNGFVQSCFFQMRLQEGIPAFAKYLAASLSLDLHAGGPYA